MFDPKDEVTDRPTKWWWLFASWCSITSQKTWTCLMCCFCVIFWYVCNMIELWLLCACMYVFYWCCSVIPLSTVSYWFHHCNCFKAMFRNIAVCACFVVKWVLIANMAGYVWWLRQVSLGNNSALNTKFNSHQPMHFLMQRCISLLSQN